MKLRREFLTAEMIEPGTGKPVRTPIEVRFDPLTGHSSRYRAMTSNEATSPCSIWDTRATLTPMALAMLFCARPSCLRAWAS